ncbi:hypothetical protein K502DRAFT_289329 [Neoconidiobolus thromboides FSU 785]|nr:hypothetical protein K502DRAFT_289329 [Neoconidiobolus thromboides FSU 785]
MLCRVNAIRAKHGKKALKMDDKLNRAARRHSQDQLDHKKMTHEGTKVKSFWDRIKNEGYKLMGGSENCAAGQGSIAQVVSDWEQSSGHFRNIVSDAECMGWGEAGNYWTQEFAKGTPCTYQTVPDCSKYH